MSTMNRREFIRTGGVALTGLLYLPACASKMMEEAAYRFFSPEEAACVIALCEQIIPADDSSGGASDAGVIFYIDRQLAGYMQEYGPIYRDHLGQLQTYCNNEFGKTFQDLDTEVQISIMEGMESNQIGVESWKNPSRFFNLILSHTMQGFYGSPIHGGNKNYMSFEMLQLEYPLNIGQNRYEKPLHEI